MWAEPVHGVTARIRRQASGQASADLHQHSGRIGLTGDQTGPPASRERDQTQRRQGKCVQTGTRSFDTLADAAQLRGAGRTDEQNGQVHLLGRHGPAPLEFHVTHRAPKGVHDMHWRVDRNEQTQHTPRIFLPQAALLLRAAPLSIIWATLSNARRQAPSNSEVQASPATSASVLSMTSRTTG